MTYKLKVPYTYDFYLVNSTDLSVNIPRMRSLQTNEIITLRNHCHTWLQDHNITYDIESEEIESDEMEYDIIGYIVFENKSDAMLFKLTWL